MLVARGLRVGGLSPLSTIDWPGRLAAVVFCRGCPWRCPYCHNPELQRVAGETIAWDRVLAFLNLRVGLLDGVVFSGGEPCLWEGLEEAIREVRSLGFAIGLHTAGSYPDQLSTLLGSGEIDWVGFDFKAPLEEYPAITGQASSGMLARRSLQILIESGVEYELRTTVYAPVLDRLRMRRLGQTLADSGGGHLVLQECRGCPDSGRQARAELTRMAEDLFPVLGPVAVRSA